MKKEEIIKSRAYQISKKAIMEKSISKGRDYIIGFEDGVEWADKTMIEKVCQWLEFFGWNYITDNSEDGNSCEFDIYKMVMDLRKAMINI